MTKFPVASRFDEKYKGEKCPLCLMIFTSFVEISEYQLGCYGCGAIFMPEFFRDSEKAGQKEQMEKQVSARKLAEAGTRVATAAERQKRIDAEFDNSVEGEEKDPLICDVVVDGVVCGKECKTVAGVFAHKRQVHPS